MKEEQYSRQVYDLVVLGGGVSGSMAAIAAARLGVSVLLIEEQGFLGGSLTAMGVGPMMSFHNSLGEQVVHGIPDELIQRLVKRGASPGHIPDSITYCSTVTPFESEALKMELEAMLLEAGGQILFHTQLAEVTVTNGAMERISVCNKAGLSDIFAHSFIDATGDGDLAARAGVPFSMGRQGDEATQPMTMNLKLANVDAGKIRSYVRENPEDFIWHPLGKEEGLRRMEATPRLSLYGYKQAWNQATESGEISIPRDGVLFFETAQPGVFIINTTRICGLDATNPFDLSRAEILGRQQCQQLFSFLRKQCPGFENAIRLDAAPKIGIRESRHIDAAYILTEADLASGRTFADTIALGGYPIDIHSPNSGVTHTTALEPGAIYKIPLRSLLPTTITNLIVVGRCIGATHEASAALRVTPIAMAIGQAGGVAAAVSILEQVSPADCPFQKIREVLLTQGARLV